MEQFAGIAIIGGVVFALFVLIRAWLSFKYSRESREWSRKYHDALGEVRKRDDTIEHNNSLIRDLIADVEAKDKLYSDLCNVDGFPFKRMATLIADFQTLQYQISANHLLNKPRPARKEAQRIQELRREARALVEQRKLAQYRYEFLIDAFPELEIYAEDAGALVELSEFENLDQLERDADRTRMFLSKEEYAGLPEQERNQLALDRYVERRKSNWQIGRDYEMFIGHEYEKDGWDVDYFGIDKKLEDLGRDLIARKGSKVHVIQCKYWSQSKLIHENHICQLYGTAIHYTLAPEYSRFHDETVTPVMVTNITLSRTAQQFADFLKVQIRAEKPMEAFPRIKCNIGSDGSKIYHLPMDQQYDSTKINRPGEFFAFTVEEAMSAGFRRAFRWRGDG